MIVKQRNDFDKFLDAYNAFKQYGIRDPLLETSHYLVTSWVKHPANFSWPDSQKQTRRGSSRHDRRQVLHIL
jgi:hypothetical protein